MLNVLVTNGRRSHDIGVISFSSHKETQCYGRLQLWVCETGCCNLKVLKQGKIWNLENA